MLAIIFFASSTSHLSKILITFKADLVKSEIVKAAVLCSRQNFAKLIIQTFIIFLFRLNIYLIIGNIQLFQHRVYFQCSEQLISTFVSQPVAWDFQLYKSRVDVAEDLLQKHGALRIYSAVPEPELLK